MIDWKTAKPADFDCLYESQETTETQRHIQIPVRIVHRNSGETAFTKSVQIRKDFFIELKKRPDFIEIISKIILTRCRDDVIQRIAVNTMSIDDKVALIDLDAQPIE